jgi:hypothetical protein
MAKVSKTDFETIAYYDAMLAEAEQRAKDDLPMTEEYQRLSNLADQPPTQLGNGLVSMTREVNDFLEAFDRAQAKRKPVN